MTTLSAEFKRKIADLYLKNRGKLKTLDPVTMDYFATELLKMIVDQKKKSNALHDLEVLEYNMGLLKNYSGALKGYEPETDEYDFTSNDCKNLIDSTKKWLKLEGLV